MDDEPTMEDMALALLAAYGNLVGVIAAAATGAGMPREAVFAMLDRLDEMNSTSIDTPRVATLIARRVDMARVALLKQDVERGQ